MAGTYDLHRDLQNIQAPGKNVQKNNIFSLFLFIAEKKSKERLAAYGAEIADLNYGNISYVDRGEGEVILSIHGIFGGYDQKFCG